ncbi:hypothetical protein AUEXF2481DRAFT_620843 [Aureobasidium subglaciale EXF-2481]|uniref:Uncharacterized protein n=1 Tax=Aureobasidium subglaciale (strain EXF-2481) TaxID=1043005 RepID=A0A074YGR5_AURSE|nr:uncharacterized protein AUEXF2481DRAFT_620843 [Aureobasidium subglaciale EXF-2481]KEQ96925.1 hypothetical protein AUEXF2481DRAFT_620843 [Aureobasidium subglaciale EXF-2481]
MCGYTITFYTGCGHSTIRKRPCYSPRPVECQNWADQTRVQSRTSPENCPRCPAQGSVLDPEMWRRVPGQSEDLHVRVGGLADRYQPTPPPVRPSTHGSGYGYGYGSQYGHVEDDPVREGGAPNPSPSEVRRNISHWRNAVNPAGPFDTRSNTSSNTGGSSLYRPQEPATTHSRSAPRLSSSGVEFRTTTRPSRRREY